jgi:probable F420-dependent oxidoreductase
MSQIHPFRFGCINEQMKPAKAWRKHVRKIEVLGYNLMLMRDHFVPDVFGDTFGPIAALMAAADATSELRLGTMVICNDFRHPAILAKEVATLDQLSGGRFELGIGAGWMRAEYERMNIPYDTPGTRIRRLEESIHVLRGLFDEGPSCHTGEFYKITDIDGFPKPFQARLPIMIGGGNKRILNMAGREADIVGLLITNLANGVAKDDTTGRLPCAVMERVEWVREGAGERFGEIELNSAIDVVITDDRPAGTEQFIRERSWGEIPVEKVWEMPNVFIGSTEYIVDEMFARREKYGFSYYWIPDKLMEEFAPIVRRIRGK